VDENILSQTKVPLVKLLLEFQAEEEKDQSVLDNAQEEVEEVILPMTNTEINDDVMPDMDSPEWRDYLMRQFTEDELPNGRPTCDGCRRLVRKFIGPIFQCGIADHTPPSSNNYGTATVIFQVKVQVTNEEHPLNNNVLHFEDIADVNQDNTEKPYSKHPSATAATIAEGRIYRKMLNLRGVLTAEEGSKKAEEEGEINWCPDEDIDNSQINLINLMCQRLDIDVNDFINSGTKNYADIALISRTTAQKMIQALNRIQQGIDDKPTGVNPYNPDWREKE
jgi:hypothetical protein